jgi:hypothetical protein
MREILRAIVSASFMLNLAIIATTLASSVVQADPPLPGEELLGSCTDCYICIRPGEDCNRYPVGRGCENFTANCECNRIYSSPTDYRDLCHPKVPRSID